jgi:glycosyltransferase involved in cell wall biosynthesis
MLNTPQLPQLIFLHRGRNAKSMAIGAALTPIDYEFDYRGRPLFWLLLKAWITAREVPEARYYLIEGALVYWVGYFLKRRFPKSKLILMVPEPAFYMGKDREWWRRLLFHWRLQTYRHITAFIAISDMVAADIRRLGLRAPVYVGPHFVGHPERFLAIVPTGSAILFVCERPAETGEVKGLDRVVDLARLLLIHHPHKRILLAGKGTESLQVDLPNVTGLGHVAMPEVLARCDVIIAPARYDAFCLAVAEACLAGVIPVVSSGVGAKSIVTQADPHLIVSDNAPTGYLHALEAIWRWTPAHRQAVIETLRHEAGKYTLENSVGTYCDIWNKITLA